MEYRTEIIKNSHLGPLWLGHTLTTLSITYYNVSGLGQTWEMFTPRCYD